MANVLNPTPYNPLLAPKNYGFYDPLTDAADFASRQGTAGVQDISGQKNAGAIGAVASAAAPAIGTLVGGPLGTLVGAGISAFGQGMTNKQSVDMANQQMQWNEQMMDKQNQQQLDFWNMQNEYNTPANQAQRMVEAGLYPGSVQSSPAQSLNAAGANAYQNPNLQNPLADFADTALKFAQVKNMNADTEKKESETEGQDIDNLYKPKILGQTLDINGRKIKLDEDLTAAEIAKMAQDVEIQQEQNRIAWKNANTAAGHLDLEKDKFAADQFWRGVYYQLDLYKLDQEDRKITIAAIEAATHSRAVDIQGRAVDESIRHNQVLESHDRERLDMEHARIAESIREFNKTNNRNNVQFYSGLAMKIAGAACMVIPGAQPVGVALLGGGFLVTPQSGKKFVDKNPVTTYPANYNMKYEYQY